MTNATILYRYFYRVPGGNVFYVGNANKILQKFIFQKKENTYREAIYFQCPEVTGGCCHFGWDPEIFHSTNLANWAGVACTLRSIKSYFFNNQFSTALEKSATSIGCLLVTRFPSVTTGCSSTVAPAFFRSLCIFQ